MSSASYDTRCPVKLCFARLNVKVRRTSVLLDKIFFTASMLNVLNVFTINVDLKLLRLAHKVILSTKVCRKCGVYLNLGSGAHFPTYLKSRTCTIL